MIRSFREAAALACQAIRSNSSTPPRPGGAREHRLAFESLEPRLVLDADSLVISEFLAVNEAVYNDTNPANPVLIAGQPDGDGNFSDWIEIHNPTGQSVDLGEWYLTDDVNNLSKWRFPDIVLAANAYRVVFASNGREDVVVEPGEPFDPYVDDAGNLHTNFALDGNGEYLALVGPDGPGGVAVADAYVPEYPQQYANISYGPSTATTELPFDVPALKYRVPQSNDAPLEASWMAPDFYDSNWNGYDAPLSVLITEAGTVADFAEIQNVSDQPVNTAGWMVAVNNAIGRPPNINNMHSTLWNLPDSIDPRERLYRHDAADDQDNFWGEELYWESNGPGWAIIVDETGVVVDFVVWGYSTAEIASLAVNVGGFDVTAADVWFGDSVAAVGSTGHSLQRLGGFDQNTKDDWAFEEPITRNLPNENLEVPFSGPTTPSVGYELNPPGLEDKIVIDVVDAMHDVNTSIWARIPFELDEPGSLAALQLEMEYNDGFVAYLNGEKVAQRNAPATLQWDSAATDSVEGSSQIEQIDISEFTGLLQRDTNVLAIHGLNAVDASSGDGDDDFIILPGLSATMRQYFASPTLGSPNGPGFWGPVKDTKFSFDRGFYEEPFDLEITSGTPGATIRYTLDGSVPTETIGEVYEDPLPISTTTVVRAVAFKPGYTSTNVDTQTYIFLNDVIQQPNDPAGFPSAWGGTAADYEMDPDIVDNPTWGNQMIDSLQSLPTISIVTKVEDMFGGSGIYTNPGGEGVGWERPASVEWIEPDGTTGFQVDAGLRIYGGAFRGMGLTRKKTFRLLFKAEYGPTKLDFPLFDAEDAATSFDTIILRGGANDGWNNWGREKTQYIVDEFMRRTQLALGQPAAHGTFAHLYLNGLYWGLYNPVERPEASFAATYFGGDKQEWDAINSGAATGESSTATWNELLSFVRNNNMSTMEAYQRLQGNNPDGTRNPAYNDLLDIDNYIAYMFSNFWGGTGDWPGHNWYGAAHKPPQTSGYKFFNWDSEGAIVIWSDLNANVTGVGNSLAEPYAALRNNPEFKLRFADYVQQWLYNGGPATAGPSYERYKELVDEVKLAIIAESARWGDQASTTPYTQAYWSSQSNYILNSYMPQRPSKVLEQLSNPMLGLYPNVAAPEFYVDGSPRHGGMIAPTDLLTMPAAGTVYYTLDGSDPRRPGGAINWGHVVEYDNTPILFSTSALVRARRSPGGEWSALNEATFFVDPPATAENLVITELNYNPYAPTQAEQDANYIDTDFEFVELYNNSDETIYLGGTRFTQGIDFDFADAEVLTLGTGEYLVVARNTNAFRMRYGTQIDVVGGYDTKLNNDGERIALIDSSDQPIFDFTYGDSGAWPGRADGTGSSLELIDLAGDPAVAASWRSSSEYGGSPGVEGDGPRSDVVINEVLTHTDSPQCDTIELHNTTGGSINIGGWFLSDSNNNLRKFRIPAGTSIPAGGYIEFDEDDFNPTWNDLPPRPAPNDFGLDGAHGDDVWLLEADDQQNLISFVDHVEFGAAHNGESFGRWPNGSGYLYPMIKPPTLGIHSGENSGPRVGPVIISEVMPQPKNTPTLDDADDFEFVEIYNTTDEQIDLTQWRIRKEIDFNFPAGTMLGPHDALVVVPFSFGDSVKLAAFCQRYGIDTETVQIVGGYSGMLGDEGAMVQLQRPDQPPLDELGFIPRLLEDEIHLAPWPAGAAATGRSLHRQSDDAWGNDPISWEDAAPTPGIVLPAGQSQVMGQHVFYNGSAFGQVVATDKSALLPGETASFANYTSYSRGINGVMVDILGLAEDATLGADDFDFRMGNEVDANNWPINWTGAPDPASIAISSGGGQGGSDRVTLTWNDPGTANGAVTNQWLEVTVLATVDTGLPDDYVFYLGNAVGETGNSSTDAKVNATDVLMARNNPRNFTLSAPIDFSYDFDRDGRVNATDMLLARENQTHILAALKLISVPEVNDEKMNDEARMTNDEKKMAPPSLRHSSFVIRASSVELAWLYELGQGDMSQQRPNKNVPAATAVDELLAPL